ncbi:MAG TPA: helix-turn-helix domain-containing protein [Alphaproteobacteria bacterium]|nr:helix-turn-helix domain-containing protein [Alphaproteobacteria bacterium]
MAALSAAPAAPGGRPRILIAGARALYLGPGLGLSPHRNGVASVAVALDRPFELELFEETPAKPAETLRLALIPPNRMHRLRPQGDMAFLYLDALSDDLTVLTQRIAEAAADDGLFAGLRALRGQAAVSRQDFDGALGLFGIGPARMRMGAVAEIVRLIDRRPQDFGPVAEAARLANLSASRFQRVFRAETGVPYRRYRLWRRMAVVAASLSAGASLTEAALDAGFGGSAHLSAAFRAMFGIMPSLLLSLGTEIRPLD